MSKSPYDPKLREAAEQFNAMCKKYDCMAVCLLVSPTHAEFVNVLDPSWSVMRPEGPAGIRFRSKKEDFNSKEEQHESTEATTHGVTSIVEWSRQTNRMWSGILSTLQKHMKIFYKTWADEPDSIPGDGK
jgi:hypothetical protein